MWMNGVRIRGWALPEGDPIDLYADGDRWTTDPVPGAEVAAEGWILPGLVDVHTHPGAQNLGDTFDQDRLRDDMRRHLDAGVTLIRAPGLAGEPPEWFGRDEQLPRSVHAGQWFAQAGQFVDGWARRPDLADLPAVAAEQAARTGWAKIIGDWLPVEPSVPKWDPVLRETVAAVHAAGGRVAMHSQMPESAAAAVAAGVDSIEHGMAMDHALLDEMARAGIALTPTLSVIKDSLRHMSRTKTNPRRQWFIEAATAHPALAAAAHEAGVLVLAGTDSHPTGRIIDEIQALVAAGVPAVDAIGAASWRARSFLGFGGLTDGDPADAVVYDADPRTDLGQLEAPGAIVLRGRLVLRR
jgi:imidazolonepropionase-like amidohydrolase